MTLLISVNSAWNIVNYRMGLVNFLQGLGHKLILLVPPDDHLPTLTQMGFQVIPLTMNPRSLNPLDDLKLYLAYRRIFRQLKNQGPLVYLGFTIKPNIYGNLAARSYKIPCINNIAGLGTLFVGNTPITFLAKTLYRIALGKAYKVFFQNVDDKDFFLSKGIVQPPQALLLPGSGVNTNQFFPTPMPPLPLRCILVGRLFKDKGVHEYAQAAAQIRSRYPQVQFDLLGFINPNSKDSITQADLDQWANDGTITYLGSTNDVRPAIQNAHCLVLPTYYREGTPRTLLEASALGRVLITTDTPGCRDVLDPGKNGYFCEPRSVPSLVQAIEALLALDHQGLQTMGTYSRQKVEQEFREELVLDRYGQVIQELTEKGW